MFHTAAYYSQLAASAVYGQLAAVADAALTRNAGNQYIMPDNLRVMAAHCQGIGVGRCQIQAPSLRRLAYPEVFPVIQSIRTAVPDLQGVQIYLDNGPRLERNEAVGVYASEVLAAVSPTNAALWIGDRVEQAPPGPQFTLVATGTITTVDQQWALGTMAFETVLATGDYLVTGLEVVADNSNYARLVFPGSTGMRPGVPVLDVLTDKQWRDSFRLGRFGSFGRFTFNNPPQIELFGAAAAATPFVCYMDVIKVA